MENALKYGDGRHVALIFPEDDECVQIAITNGGCTLSKDFFFSAAGQMGYGVELLLAVCGKDSTFRCRVTICGLQHELHAIRIATFKAWLP